VVREKRVGVFPLFFYFFSTLTFWLSQERPSKIPRRTVSTSTLRTALVCVVRLTLSTGGATGLNLPHVVLSYSVEVECLSYIVWSHCCEKVWSA